MGIQADSNQCDTSEEWDQKEPAAAPTRSFRLAPAGSGVRSFQLTSSPFWNRRPVQADVANGKTPSNDVKSFRLASSQTGAKSFQLS
jgi:hypothetical protein